MTQKRTRQEQETDMLSALAMLQRAKSGGATTGGGDGPVDPSFAIGWAMGCLRRALGFVDQPTGNYQT